MGSGNIRAFVINLAEREDRLMQFKENKFPFPVERFDATRNETGCIGCASSHLALLAEQKEYPFAVFEDDVILLQPWDIVDTAISQLPKEWDALWIGATLMKKQVRYSANLFKIDEGLCLFGIIYNSKRMVDYIINNYHVWARTATTPIAIDVFYAYHIQQIFNCYIVTPLIATQRPGYSDIEKRDVNYTQIVDLFNIHAI